eukprot:TRINITY_DN29297_c0_g1_i1.p1 TRINITY_DN29297_c0_g1~~TRINITY_DN29297_c0_g1_i1.p1  ORF type:complete len:108 (+),score=2.40 TRINITY_DN29297_c0_g1_i1:76-399(+)
MLPMANARFEGISSCMAKRDPRFLVRFWFEPLPALMAGELDLVITSDIQPRSEVHYEPLFDFEMRLITAINSPLADKRALIRKILAYLTMLSYPVTKQSLDVSSNYF